MRLAALIEMEFQLRIGDLVVIKGMQAKTRRDVGVVHWVDEAFVQVKWSGRGPQRCRNELELVEREHYERMPGT